MLVLVTIGTGLYLFSVNKKKMVNDSNTSDIKIKAPTETSVANMPNPASVYCSDHGGRSEIRTASDGSQSGFCVFPDGEECDEWMFFRSECPNPTSGVRQAVQTFLANKYQKLTSEVNVTVTKEEKGFAAGSVSFGPGELNEGGMWLAVAGNRWDVVWDGNGSIDCNKLRQKYGFPDSILKPNFCD